jgi:hypothetical protein
MVKDEARWYVARPDVAELIRATEITVLKRSFQRQRGNAVSASTRVAERCRLLTWATPICANQKTNALLPRMKAQSI